jgi:ribosomal protein S18 acetylase RimI-like enzyme
MQIETVKEITIEFLQALARLLPQLAPEMNGPDLAEIQKMIAAEDCTQLVARLEPGGPIAGMLTLIVFRTPTGTQAWIEDVVVDETARGQGLGEALTRAGMQRALDLGAKSVSLTSRPARAAANRLYLRMGFQRWETNLYRYVFTGAEKFTGG